jgi:Protein of unknown function (DUF3800)
MAWLLFMDESGHSHRELPYEVRGGYALADTHLWPFVQDVLRLELSCFGSRLVDYKSEVKGMKLLRKDRFEHAGQMSEIEAAKRQHLCRALLQAGLEKRPPTREQLTAYGQASLRMADGIFDLLERHKAVIFASAVPRGTAKPPSGTPPPPDILRKDHNFLLERFFYFLERERQMGLLVMDEVEKKEDRRFVQKLHDYFVKTANGRERSRWIVPAPFFVASDMALPVQVADLVIYTINWGYRHPAEMTAPTRAEIARRFGERIDRLKWKGEGYNGAHTYRSFGIVCVPDLYVPRT